MSHGSLDGIRTPNLQLALKHCWPCLYSNMTHSNTDIRVFIQTPAPRTEFDYSKSTLHYNRHNAETLGSK